MSRRPPPARAPSGLTRDETRESLRRFNVSAGLRGVFDTVGGGTTFIFVAFAGTLGLAGEQMGWLTALVSWACLLQMAGLPLIARARDKKRFALRLALGEAFLVCLAVLLAVFLPAPWGLYAFAAAVFLAAAFLQLSRPVTDDWVASTVPAGLRGRYLGRRTQILSAVVVVATLAAGWLGERVGLDNRRGLGLLILAAAAFAVAAVVVLRGASMPAVAAASQPQLADVATALRTRPFLRLLTLTVLYNLPFFVACPYYQVFNLQVARMPATHIAWMQTGYLAVKVLALPALGRLVDRWGARRTMVVAGLVYAWFFSTFLFCGPGYYWPVMLAWAVVALADGGFGLAAQAALYATVPEAALTRPAYFAVNNFVVLAAYGLGSALVVPLLRLTRDVSVTVGPFTLGHFHLLYGFCAVLMLPCLCAARLLPAKDADKAPA